MLNKVHKKYLSSILTCLLIFSVILQVFGALLVVKAENTIVMDVTDEGGGDYTVDVYSDDETRTITSVQYSIEGYTLDGETWIDLPAESGAYDTSWVTVLFSSSTPRPAGTHNVTFKAIDNLSDEWFTEPYSYTSTDNISISIDDLNYEDWVEVYLSSLMSLIPVTVQYRINEGSWVDATAGDGAFDSTTEYFNVMRADIPNGSQTMDVQVVDQWGDTWPESGMETATVTGTAVAANPGTSAGNPASITASGNTYSFTDNSDGSRIYLYANVSVGTYYVETYETESGVDPALTYFDTDSTYTTQSDFNDDYSSSVQSRIDFTSTTAGYHYFTLDESTSSTGGTIGIRLVPNNTSSSPYVTTYNTVTSGSDSTVNIPLNVQSTENNLIALHVAYRSTTDTISEVAFNSDAFTKACNSLSSEYANEIWYLSNPSLYNGNVTVTFSGAVEDIVAGVALINTINETDPVSASACNQDSGWSNNPSVSVTTSSNQIVFGGVNTYTGSENDLTAGLGQDQVWNLETANVIGTATVMDGDEGGSTTMTWSGLAEWPWSTSAIALNLYTPSGDTTGPSTTFTVEPDSMNGYIINLAGTATDDESTITSVEVSYTPDYNEELVTITPVDSAFDSGSEAFTISIKANQTAQYALLVTVNNSSNLHSTYSYNFNVDVRIPVFELDNLGAEPLDDNTPTYTGEARAIAETATVAKVEYLVISGLFGGVFIDWTEATPVDTYNSAIEDFTFTTSQLPEGVNYIMIRVTDSLGNVTSGDQLNYPGAGFTGDRIIVDAVDNAEPIIQLQQIVPNPTTDPEPKLQGKVRDDETEKHSFIASLEYKIDDGAWTTLPTYDGDIGTEIEEFFSIPLTSLTLGEHTVYVRTEDSIGNDTQTAGTNAHVDFTIIEQPEDLTSVDIDKTEDFSTHNDQDFIDSENIIWGNGQLRLAEEMSPTRTTLSTSTIADAYADYRGSIAVSPSASNGVWMTKIGDVITYYNNVTHTETNFDLTNYGYAGSGLPYDIQEYKVGNNYHVWVAVDIGIIGINFGTSITDGVGDSYSFYSPAHLGIVSLILDKRQGTDYGIYYMYDGGVGYYKPGVIGTDADDLSVTFTEADGYVFDNVTAIYLDTATNYLWVADYNEGVTIVNDNGTPLTKADDVNTLFDGITQVFSIGKDKNNKIFFGGDHGVQVRLEDAGTFAAADDTIYQLATNADLGVDVVTKIEYLPGDSVVGGQFFIGTRSGIITYLSANDTYTDKLDDQIITIDVPAGVYPASVDDFYFTDNNNLVVGLARMGAFLVDLNRGFADTGVAVTEIDAQIEGRLDADFITLNSVDISVNAGAITYEVSNDGGITWYPIQIGETVNFAQTDYRIKFRITMQEGSTPVINAFNLSYSAYKTGDSRSLNIDIENEPDEVITGEEFSFDVSAFDQLYNPYEEPTTVNLQLKRLTDNETIHDFNVSSALIDTGIATIEHAKASVLGAHYIYAQTDGITATSDIINFVDRPVTNPVPALSFTADEYVVKAGETVKLSWTSSYLDTLTLSSQETAYGIVATSGSKYVVINKDTVFTLSGEGQYGDLSRSLRIRVSQEGQDDAGDPPVIEKFEINQENAGDKDRVTITWLVKNVESVDIVGVGKGLPAEGSAQVFISEDTKFTIFAENKYGQATETKEVDFVRLPSLPKTGSDEDISSTIALLPAIGALFVAITGISLTLAQGSLGTIFAGVINRLGILFGFVIRKRKKYWGIVFDVEKSEPIPFAVVRLYKDNQLVAEVVSDMDGRYGFALEQGGTYKLEVSAQGFVSFTKQIKMANIGDNIEYVEDIPMVRDESTKRAFFKYIYYAKRDLFKYMKLVLASMMVVGFVYTLYVTFYYPGLSNYILLGIYGILFAFNAISIYLFLRRSSGRVIDEQSGQGIEGVSVRVYDKAKQVGIYLTNKEGVVKMNAKTGSYWIIAHKEGYEAVVSNIGAADKGKFDEIQIDKAGYINKNIVLRRVKQSINKTLADVKELENPFS